MTRSMRVWLLLVAALLGCSAAPEGHYEACCVATEPSGVGRIESCFCSASAVCNYGLFTPCSDGGCVQRYVDRATEVTCHAPGGPSIEGLCCEDLDEHGRGRIVACLVPLDAHCGYGLLDCGEGRCVPADPCGDAGAPSCGGDAGGG